VSDAEDILADTRALARKAWGSAVEILDVAPLAGDASSRRYFRARVRGMRAPTAVLMVQSGSGLSISSDELSSVGDVAEMPFLNVQRYLRSRDIAVPDVYAEDATRGLALLEDVGDTTLWDAARAAADPAPLYRAAIDELVSLQRAGAERPDPRCIAFRQRFDARLFLWELEHFLEYGFSGRTLASNDLAWLRGRFAELAEALAAGPYALTHRDYHSWNLFVHAGAMRVIDFQDALLAPYDLATLLNDRATPTLVDPALERALVAYFCERRCAAFPERLQAETLLPSYFLFVLQKSLKIVGRFHYLEEVKGKRGYVAMLPHTFATLRRCFDNLPALGDVRARLARSFSELG
jgi:aminoglycoside/choline kinase family phosphotransferase